ncbi:MAG: hypothetical protein ACJAWK_001929, partial [Candidatus Azotimanducaceae bacterium]
RVQFPPPPPNTDPKRTNQALKAQPFKAWLSVLTSAT